MKVDQDINESGRPFISKEPVNDKTQCETKLKGHSKLANNCIQQ